MTKRFRGISRSLLSWSTCALSAIAIAANADGWPEDFSSNPSARGWCVAGNASLFRWDSTNQNLAVTWDSSRSNSFFARSLDTVLTKADDFSFSFEVKLTDVAVGVNSNKPFTFQIAVGLVRLASVTDNDFWRGSGVSAPHGPRNLVELTWFPDSGFGATVSPTLVSSNNQFATGFDFPLELDPGATFHFVMHYTATNQTLRTTVLRNGAPFGPVKNVVLGPNFTDFRLDHVAVCSYSDTGADGSILAHGTVDNISVAVPAPAIKISDEAPFGVMSNGVWMVTIHSQSGFEYDLLRSTNSVNWTTVAGPLPGTGGVLALPDNSPPPNSALYRVGADKP
jgi:hypothetical protein